MRHALVAPSHEGAWIEICASTSCARRAAVAPSHEGAWIEIWSSTTWARSRRVAPSHEGAWIEIAAPSPRAAWAWSPPHTRGRGLKFIRDAQATMVVHVAPSHEGAWIEIARTTGNIRFPLVAPSHEGAWIEIRTNRPCRRFGEGRPLTRGGVD